METTNAFLSTLLGNGDRGGEYLNATTTPLLVSALAVAVAMVIRVQQKSSSTSNRKTPKPADAQIPPHVHSWIPFVGSAVAMGQNGIAHFVISKAKALAETQKTGTQNSGRVPVFTATILGDKCLFIADPADLMAAVFGARIQKYLDVVSLQKQFVKNCLGATTAEIDFMFAPDVMKASVPLYHHYLFKGQQLEQSMARVQEYFHQWIPSVVDATGDWKRYNLYDLVGEAVFKASTGPFLSDICPKSETVYSNFRAFDQGVIALFNSVPPFLLKSTIAARDSLLNLVKSKDFWTQASPLMHDRRELLVRDSLSEEALDRANLGLLWASSGNSIPAVFWMLARLLEDPVAWRACVDQVKEIMAKRTDASSSGFTLDELDQMTLLESSFWEALRLYQANITARKVVQDFCFETASGQKYWITKGTKIMAYWEVLHRDPHVHDSPLEFRYDRFVDKDKVYKFASGKTLTHGPVVPFGGGSHLCPGR